jgi:hypothetical protein
VLYRTLTAVTTTSSVSLSSGSVSFSADSLIDEGAPRVGGAATDKTV